jgi:hypothetical protein
MKQTYQGAAHVAGLMPAKLRMILALPVLALLSVLPALGEESYSYEEQEACTTDAFRLCSDLIPDIPRITACMQAKKDQLSPKCAKMFAPGRDRHLNESGETPYHDKTEQSRQDH